TIVVFSSELLLKSARDVSGMLIPHAVVIAQGQSIIPEKDDAEGAKGGEDVARIIADHKRDQFFLCIGCGYVQMRKGVDLFIATAAKVARDIPGAKFLWVGDGYNPDQDYQISIWLK